MHKGGSTSHIKARWLEGGRITTRRAWLLSIFLQCFASFCLERASSSPSIIQRIVATLDQYNACEIDLPQSCASVAKCYGRRLVLDVRGCGFSDEGWAAAVVDPGLDPYSPPHPSSSLSTTNPVLAAVEAWARGTLMISNLAFVEEDGTLEVAQLLDSEPYTQQQQQQQQQSIGPHQWNLDMVGVRQAWASLQTYGESSTIAVLDSGIAESAMPAFSSSSSGGGSRLKPGYDFISDPELSMDGDARDADYFDTPPSPSCLDSAWHGTKVSSILAANLSSYQGVAPASSIRPVRVLGRCSVGFASDVADAIVWAAGGVINGLQEGVSPTNADDIILMAFAGLGSCPSFMQTAVDLAVSRGVQLFAAAGNDPDLYASDHFPANCRGVRSVGALNSTGQVASDYSSMLPDILMPGGDSTLGVPCLSSGTSPPDAIQSCVGTSMAAPHAAGLAALSIGKKGGGGNGQPLLDAWVARPEFIISTYHNNNNNLLVRGQAVAPYRAASVVAGYYFSCALLIDRSVKCWGFNGEAQLGDGTFTRRTSPVFVSGLGPGTVSQLSVGSGSSCVIMAADSSARCWGWNSNGNIGDGTQGNYRTAPVPVIGLDSNVSSIAVGGQHACAVLAVNGSVACWGSNANGQLGDGTTTKRITPGLVVGLRGPASAVYCSTYHSCAILNDTGGVQCWGSNSGGQLGDNTQAQRNNPVDMQLLGGASSPRAVQIMMGGSHTCVLLEDQSVQCVGANNLGQLGDGTWTMRRTPVRPVGLGPGNVSQIGASQGETTCALMTSGDVRCWGSNSHSQVGDLTQTNSNVPKLASTLNGAQAIGVGMGAMHACAIMASDGGLKCWGRNDQAQMGDGTITSTGCVCKASAVSTNLGTYNAPAPCPDGTSGIGIGYTCTPCANGTYSAANQTFSCTACPAGTYTLGVGSSSCIGCPAGKFSTASRATSSAVCANCPRGAYSQASRSSACSKCAAGTYSDLVGSMTNETCTMCPAGTFAAGAGATACVACVKGSFSSASGATACSSCLAGTASSLQ